jgi:glyoxylase-like metal-dependent hydrolase (beta-lactamase superfamily II)
MCPFRSLLRWLHFHYNQHCLIKAAALCRDDIGDQEKWAAKFGATRIMHETEIRPYISDIEIQLSGEGPWNLSGEVIQQDTLDGGVQIVHVPGHTEGSLALWHASTKTMFTGDHLGWSEHAKRIDIFPRYNRAGVKRQVESVKKLLEYDFMHVLPGHGRRFTVKNASERLQMVSDVARVHA